jgi:hypothetical protein
MNTVFLFRYLLILMIFVVSCDVRKKSIESEDKNILIQGTWELLSETKIENGDTTYSEASKAQPMIKIINKTHFAFLRHDLKQGKDSTALFVAGGGRYALKDHEYTEYLDYFISREWENNTFHFTVSVKNDTLIQSGTEKVEGLGIDRIIIEKYKRIGE